MVSILSTLALILSLGGQFLLAKKTKIVFPIWVLSNILWIVVNVLGSFNIQQVIMYLVYTGFNVYSWISWSKSETKDNRENAENLVLVEESNFVN